MRQYRWPAHNVVKERRTVKRKFGISREEVVTGDRGGGDHSVTLFAQAGHLGS